MFERFTERARGVILLAREEAGRLRHDVVGTEHLLLGLIRIGGSGGAVVLGRLGIGLEVVEAEVRQALADVPQRRGGRDVPFSPSARRVVERAIESARQLGRSHIGSEHLLLGLTMQTTSIASKILESHGAAPESVRRALEAGNEAAGEQVIEAVDDLPAIPDLVEGSSVCLIVRGPNLDPAALSAQIGCLPTRAHRRDVAAQPGMTPSSTGMWSLELRGETSASAARKTASGGETSTGPDQLIGRLLSRLPTDPEFWAALTVECDVHLRITMDVREWNKGFELSADTVAAIAGLHTSVIFDVYGNHDA